MSEEKHNHSEEINSNKVFISTLQDESAEYKILDLINQPFITNEESLHQYSYLRNIFNITIKKAHNANDSDKIALFIKAFKVVAFNNDIESKELQAICLTEIAHIYVDNGEYANASALYNAALVRFLNDRDKEKLKEYLDKLEEKFLTSIKCSNFSDEKSPVYICQNMLAVMRDDCKVRLKDIDSNYDNDSTKEFKLGSVANF